MPIALVSRIRIGRASNATSPFQTTAESADSTDLSPDWWNQLLSSFLGSTTTTTGSGGGGVLSGLFGSDEAGLDELLSLFSGGGAGGGLSPLFAALLGNAGAGAATGADGLSDLLQRAFSAVAVASNDPNAISAEDAADVAQLLSVLGSEFLDRVLNATFAAVSSAATGAGGANSAVASFLSIFLNGGGAFGGAAEQLLSGRGFADVLTYLVSATQKAVAAGANPLDAFANAISDVLLFPAAALNGTLGANAADASTSAGIAQWVATLVSALNTPGAPGSTPGIPGMPSWVSMLFSASGPPNLEALLSGLFGISSSGGPPTAFSPLPSQQQQQPPPSVVAARSPPPRAATASSPPPALLPPMAFVSDPPSVANDGENAATAGIAVAIVLAVIAVLALVVFLRRRHVRRMKVMIAAPMIGLAFVSITQSIDCM